LWFQFGRPKTTLGCRWWLATRRVKGIRDICRITLGETIACRIAGRVTRVTRA